MSSWREKIIGFYLRLEWTISEEMDHLFLRDYFRFELSHIIRLKLDFWPTILELGNAVSLKCSDNGKRF